MVKVDVSVGLPRCGVADLLDTTGTPNMIYHKTITYVLDKVWTKLGIPVQITGPDSLSKRAQ